MSPWCFFLSLSHLANHLPVFCCISLVTHPTGASCSDEFIPYVDPLKKRRGFWGYCCHFPLFSWWKPEPRSVDWGFSQQFLHGLLVSPEELGDTPPQWAHPRVGTLLTWLRSAGQQSTQRGPAELFVRNACSNGHKMFWAQSGAHLVGSTKKCLASGRDPLSCWKKGGKGVSLVQVALSDRAGTGGDTHLKKRPLHLQGSHATCNAN